MAWEHELVTILRHLIDDTDQDNYTYSDDRLITALVVGASLVKTEVSLENTYTIDVDSSTITPDPTDPRDDGFITLVCLRTAIIILAATLKAKSAQAVKVTDGPSTIDLSSSIEGVKTLYEDMLKRYELTKFEYKLNEGAVGKAVYTKYIYCIDQYNAKNKVTT